jgi:uncharacterized membrane protein YtjA (UPF0391 family)
MARFFSLVPRNGGEQNPCLRVSTLALIALSEEDTMLGWAATFFIIAIVAALFGFGGLAAGAAQIAQILFVIFLVLFVVSLIVSILRGRAPPLS